MDSTRHQSPHPAFGVPLSSDAALGIAGFWMSHQKAYFSMIGADDDNNGEANSDQ